MQIDRDRIALAVQQPWAELIVRGIKTIEVRKTNTRVRGAIYIYASRKTSELSGAFAAARDHDLKIDELPRGLLVGTAELTESRPALADDARDALLHLEQLTGRIAWRFERPGRFDAPLRPKFIPYGIWFYPFRRK